MRYSDWIKIATISELRYIRSRRIKWLDDDMRDGFEDSSTMDTRLLLALLNAEIARRIPQG